MADIHLDEMGVRYVQMLDLTAREHPDIIVLTGDESVVKTPENMSWLTQIAKRLTKTAPVYAVEGNWDMPDDMDALRAGGAKVVTDQWLIAKGRNGAKIALCPALWYNSSLPDAPKTMEPLYKVVLCHTPNIFDNAAADSYDLILSGYTHGGQIRIPIFGALLPEQRLVGKYQAGLYSKVNNHLYISRGIGMEGKPAPQIRFCCRPEIAIIDIVGEGK